MSFLFSTYSVLLIGQHNVDYDVLLRGDLFCIDDFVLTCRHWHWHWVSDI